MPAKAGIQNYLKTLDSRLRGNDVKGRFKTFYETINIDDATLYRLDWPLAARGGAYMKLHKIRCRSKKYLTAEIAEYAEIIYFSSRRSRRSPR